MKSLTLLILTTALFSCRHDTIHIGENTFVHNEKVYRIIDNQITDLGTLDVDSIVKSRVVNSVLRDFGRNEMDHVRKGAYSELRAVYRGDVLYFKIGIYGLNDLRERYAGGALILNLQDQYGFQIHTFVVQATELTRIVGDSNKTLYYEYNGKTQMSSEVNQAISTYSVASSLREKGQYDW
jgi:hypothetical protein